MKRLNDAALLERMIRRASGHTEYLGWIFARYAEIEKKHDKEIAELLGLPIHDLYRLYLCLRPRREFFLQDVRHIAQSFAIDAADLSKLVRHVEALDQMKEQSETDGSSDAGLLLAARARKSKAKVSKRRRRK